MANDRTIRKEEIAAAKGYYVDQDGNAFGPRGRLRPWLNARRYLWFTFRGVDNELMRSQVHRQQAFQLYGKAIYDSGIVVRHLDGNKLNNCASNIAIGTYSQNSFDRPQADRVAHARIATSYVRKLSDADVIAMRAARASGAKLRELAELYSVSMGCVSDILSGKQRKDATP